MSTLNQAPDVSKLSSLIAMGRSQTLIAILSHTFFIAVFTGFLLHAIALSKVTGVCCADDGAFALLAKNLAWGHGYLSTVGYHSSSFPKALFDSTVQTTGPAVILPAAGLIWFFGNQYWVPGLALISIWVTLIFAIYKTLCYVVPPPRVSAVSTAFLVIIYALSSWHFEHWWALLGEVPAALLVILGFCIWAIDPDSKRHLFMSSLFIGLAVTAKLLSLLYVGAFVLVVLIWRLSGASVKKPQRAFVDICLASITCLLPLLCFEIWKLLVLGFAVYVQNIQQFLEYSSEQGLQSKILFFSQLSERSRDFYEHFGVSLWIVLLLTGTSLLLAFRTRNDWFRRFAAVAFVGILIHLIYWLIFSIGWPRYIYSGVVLMCFIMAIPLLIIDRMSVFMLYTLLIAVSLNGALGRINYSAIQTPSKWFLATSERQGQAVTTEFLDAHSDRRPFVAQWGGSVTDLEYLSKTVGNFTGYQALKRENFERGFLVVANAKFDHFGAAEDSKFTALVSRCGSPVLVAQPYTVYDCKPQK